MIWKHSKFYNTPPALALLMRMLCNAVIEKSREFVGDSSQLFGLEPKEAVDKLALVLDVCRKLKYDYFMYYNLSKTQCESNPWMADRGNMFKRLDLFITRCEDLLHLCKTAQQFEKMANVVIGGNAGATLTNDMRASPRNSRRPSTASSRAGTIALTLPKAASRRTSPSSRRQSRSSRRASPRCLGRLRGLWYGLCGLQAC